MNYELIMEEIGACGFDDLEQVPYIDPQQVIDNILNE